MHAPLAWRTDAPKRATIALVSLALTLPLLIARPANAAVAEPTPTGPSDGTTLSFPTEPPLFQWDAVAGATSYRIEIDDASDFIGATTATTVNTAYTLTEPQTIGQSFYWHVQALSSTGGASSWSPTWSYDISWPGSSPDLETPADGSDRRRRPLLLGSRRRCIDLSAPGQPQRRLGQQRRRRRRREGDVLRQTGHARQRVLLLARPRARCRLHAEPGRMVAGMAVHPLVDRYPDAADAGRYGGQLGDDPRPSPGRRSSMRRPTNSSSATT